MLAMFTPEELPPHCASFARRCVFQVREVPAYPEQQVHTVGVVVAGDKFLVQSPLRVIPAGVEQEVHRPARGLENDVVLAVDVAAPGVVQVREVELVHALVLHEPEQRRQLVGVVLGHGEAHADLDALLVAQADRVHRGIVGAFQAAEAVVGRLQAVNRDADVVVADAGNPVDVGFVDERAVGREADIEAHVLGAPGDIEDVRPQQRLAARENQHRHAEGLEIVHDLVNLRGRKLAGEILVGRDRIAVLAGEVAAADEIPDDDRPGRLALRCFGPSGVGLLISCMYWLMRNIVFKPQK